MVTFPARMTNSPFPFLESESYVVISEPSSQTTRADQAENAIEMNRNNHEPARMGFSVGTGLGRYQVYLLLGR